MSRFKFSIRSLFSVTALIAVVLYWFLAEYEFVSTISTTSAVSPDGRYTVRLDHKRHKNINRSWDSIELSLLNPASQVTMVAYLYPGIHFDASDEMPDYGALGAKSITWDSDSNGCTYQITNRESGRLESRQKGWELIGRTP